MIFINDKYDKRAVICELLYENYRIDNFAWSNCELLYENYRIDRLALSNQSYTTLEISLFQRRVGYLPESSYNMITRQIFDDF